MFFGEFVVARNDLLSCMMNSNAHQQTAQTAHNSTRRTQLWWNVRRYANVVFNSVWQLLPALFLRRSAPVLLFKFIRLATALSNFKAVCLGSLFCRSLSSAFSIHRGHSLPSNEVCISGKFTVKCAAATKERYTVNISLYSPFFQLQKWKEKNMTSVEQRCSETSSSDLGPTWDRRSSEVTCTKRFQRRLL